MKLSDLDMVAVLNDCTQDRDSMALNGSDR